MISYTTKKKNTLFLYIFISFHISFSAFIQKYILAKKLFYLKVKSLLQKAFTLFVKILFGNWFIREQIHFFFSLYFSFVLSACQRLPLHQNWGRIIVTQKEKFIYFFFSLLTPRLAVVSTFQKSIRQSEMHTHMCNNI